MAMRLSVQGVTELAADLETFFKALPDAEDEALRKGALKFKNETRKKVRGKVKSDKRLTSGFYTKELRGSGTLDAVAYFYAETHPDNPHWHLIEKGHDIVRPKIGRNGHPTKDPGAILGHVEGIHVMKEMAAEFGPIMEHEALKAMNKAAEEGRL